MGDYGGQKVHPGSHIILHHRVVNDIVSQENNKKIPAVECNMLSLTDVFLLIYF